MPELSISSNYVSSSSSGYGESAPAKGDAEELNKVKKNSVFDGTRYQSTGAFMASGLNSIWVS
jgi:hypothetical protein